MQINRQAREYTKEKNYDEKINKLSKTNIGKYIDEGSLLNNARKRGAHHDDENHYYISGNNEDKIIWLFGDSWGNGIHKNEIKNKTIKNTLSNKFSSLRIISTSSWSPLLMNLAFRHYLRFYNEIPNKVVIFLDQTDIGNDYCRYRPFVERDKNGNLLRVNNDIHEYRSDYQWLLNQSLEVYKSGFIYLYEKLIQRTYARLGIGTSGINTCSYFDTLAWQIGNKNSSNGTSTFRYVEYFKQNVSNFISEIKDINPKVEILLVTHDWDQNSSNATNKMTKFKNDYSSLVRLIAKNNNVKSFHVFTQDYLDYGINRNKIYIPTDTHSHLNDYSLLSRKIAEKLKEKN